jgi:hypothetical protein
MNAPEIRIETLFATPLALIEHPYCEALNSSLEELFLSRETSAYQNPRPSHLPQPETFESRFDLFHWPEPAVRQLREFMLGSVLDVVRELNHYTTEEVAALTLKNDTWFHVMRRNGSFVAHSHPMASWSAVYCVRGGEEVPHRKDSGLLRFLDTRGTTNFLDAGNARLEAPYGAGHFSVRLKPGQLVIFPAHLVHEVAPFFGSDTRITVASNCWFDRR